MDPTGPQSNGGRRGRDETRDERADRDECDARRPHHRGIGCEEQRCASAGCGVPAIVQHERNREARRQRRDEVGKHGRCRGKQDRIQRDQRVNPEVRASERAGEDVRDRPRDDEKERELEREHDELDGRQRSRRQMRQKSDEIRVSVRAQAHHAVRAFEKAVPCEIEAHCHVRRHVAAEMTRDDALPSPGDQGRDDRNHYRGNPAPSTRHPQRCMTRNFIDPASESHARSGTAQRRRPSATLGKVPIIPCRACRAAPVRCACAMPILLVGLERHPGRRRRVNAP